MLQALSDHDGGDYAVGSENTLLQHGFGARPLFHAAIAKRGDTAVGMVIYYPDYSTHRGQPGVYVQDIYVDPALRGAGAGRGLLAFMMRRQDWDAQYIALGVNPDNAEAAGFYSRLGFRSRGYGILILAGNELASVQKIHI